jgi:ABC-2 type transport system ATP-binding protein
MSNQGGRYPGGDELAGHEGSTEAVRWMRGAHAMEVVMARLRRETAHAEQDRQTDVAVIEVESLRKSYGSKEVLRGVDLRVAAGEVFCLLGPNGAGKTTAVEILEGFRSRSGGRVRVLGSDPEGQPADLRQRIGVVLQECALPGELKVAELVDAYRSYYPAPLPLGKLLSIVELEAQALSPIRNLSGGQQRRVDLALALAGDPDLVFLDEPTTGFDPVARRRSWSAIRNLAALGKTIVLTTHYLDEAQELADRVAVVVDGQVVACDSPDQLGERHLAPTRVSFELDTARSSPGVPVVASADCQHIGRRFTISTRDPEAQLQELLSWARHHELRLAGLTVSPPSLEEIYFSLVGSLDKEVV